MKKQIILLAFVVLCTLRAFASDLSCGKPLENTSWIGNLNGSITSVEFRFPSIIPEQRLGSKWRNSFGIYFNEDISWKSCHVDSVTGDITITYQNESRQMFYRLLFTSLRYNVNEPNKLLVVNMRYLLDLPFHPDYFYGQGFINRKDY